MDNKNDELARQNNKLKIKLSEKDQQHEEILKKTIKSEYNTILSYKEMLSIIENSILVLEKSIQQCKNIRDTVVEHKSKLCDRTNTFGNKESQKIINLERELIQESDFPEFKKTTKLRSKKVISNNIAKKLFPKRSK